MELRDRKLLEHIKLHASRGEVREIKNIVTQRLHALAGVPTIEYLQDLVRKGLHDRILEEIGLYRDIFPYDPLLIEIENNSLIMTCLDNK